jgi:F0F1-type ATP synthase membrane subunit c/vacuolar-type H+-ATPase subunit K
MADDKQIRVGIDDSGVKSYISNIRQQNESLARQVEETSRKMIRDARAYTTSAAEVNRFLKERISLLEKEGRLREQYNREELKGALSGGQISQPTYERRMSEMSFERGQEKLLVQELKAIREAILKTSKDEIISDRVNVEKQVAQSGSVGMLRPGGDEYQILKETYQQAELEKLKDSEVVQQGGRRAMYGGGQQVPAWMNNLEQYSTFAGLTTGIVSGASRWAQRERVGTSQSVFEKKAEDFQDVIKDVEVEATAAGFGGSLPIGVPLALIAAGLAVGFSTTHAAEQNMREAARGGFGRGKSFIGAGLTSSEWGREASLLATAGGVGSGSFQAGELGQLYAITRGSPVGAGQLGQLMRFKEFSRAYGKDFSTIAAYSQLEADLVGDTWWYISGKKKGQIGKFVPSEFGIDVNAMPEYLGMLSNLMMEDYTQTGNIRAGSAQSLMMNMMRTGARGGFLQHLMQSFQAGNMRSQNPLIQSIQFEAARAVAGEDASYWDVQKIMADPLNTDYQRELLKRYREVSGGGEMYEKVLADVYGINPNAAEELSKLKIKTKYSDEWFQKQQEILGTIAGSRMYTGSLTELEARFREGKEDLFVGAIQKLSDQINNLAKKIERMGL